MLEWLWLLGGGLPLAPSKKCKSLFSGQMSVDGRIEPDESRNGEGSCFKNTSKQGASCLVIGTESQCQQYWGRAGCWARITPAGGQPYAGLGAGVREMPGAAAEAYQAQSIASASAWNEGNWRDERQDGGARARKEERAGKEGSGKMGRKEVCPAAALGGGWTEGREAWGCTATACEGLRGAKSEHS